MWSELMQERPTEEVVGRGLKGAVLVSLVEDALSLLPAVLLQNATSTYSCSVALINPVYFDTVKNILICKYLKCKEAYETKYIL